MSQAGRQPGFLIPVSAAGAAESREAALGLIPMAAPTQPACAFTLILHAEAFLCEARAVSTLRRRAEMQAASRLMPSHYVTALFAHGANQRISVIFHIILHCRVPCGAREKNSAQANSPAIKISSGDREASKAPYQRDCQASSQIVSHIASSSSLSRPAEAASTRICSIFSSMLRRLFSRTSASFRLAT